MSSDHWTIAAALETKLTAWAATNWSGALVAGHFIIERIMQLIGDSNPIVIGIVPTTVEDQADRTARRHDEDLVSVGVIVISRLEDIDRDTLIAIDTKVGLLYKYLKTIQTVDVDGREADRDRTMLLTTFDHEQLSNEVWASMIQCDYNLDSGELGEVAA